MKKMGEKIVVMVCIAAMIMTNLPNWDAGADVSGTAPSDVGDTLIGNATVWKDEVITLSGNLTINATGSLTLDNVTLLMNCTENGSYHIEVQSGGEMYILNNSNISSANEYHYLFWVRNDSTFEMRDSELSECGYTINNCFRVYTDDVLIENSLISNNHVGIFLQSSSNTISNTTIINNWVGILLYYPACNNTISNCKISQNSFIGIDLYSSTDNNTITNCDLSENHYGIRIEDFSSYNLVTNCSLFNNTLGIFIPNAFNNTISNCNISSNNDTGIFIFSSDNITISNCTISLNNNAGISTEDSSNTIISNSAISSNNETGIYLYNSSNNLILNSTISGNYSDINYHDISLYSNASLALVNTAFNKTSVHFADANSTLNVSWYLDVNVFWNNSVPAEYANVRIFDNLVNEVFSGSTDKNGLIKDIIIQEYTQNQTAGKISFTPHNVTASQGFISSSNVTVVNETKTIELILDHNAPEINETTISPEQELIIVENTTVEFSFNVSHPDNLTLTYHWYLYMNETEVKNATGTLENTTTPQKINWTHYFNYTSHGNYTVKVEVSDTNATVSYTWVLTVNDVNGKPEIEFYYPPKDIILGNHSCVIFNVTASDPDNNDEISYQWTSNGAPVSNENEYIFYAEYNASGNATNTYLIELVITDNGTPPKSVNQTWTVTVVDWNASYNNLLQQIEFLKDALENITKLIGDVAGTMLNQTEIFENLTRLMGNITAINLTVLKDKIDQLFTEVENMNVTLAQLNENLTRIQGELNNATDKIGNLTTMLENANLSRDQAIDNETMALNAKENAENATAAALKEKDEAIKAKNKAEYKLAESVVTAVICGIIAGFFVSFLLRRKLPKKGKT